MPHENPEKSFLYIRLNKRNRKNVRWNTGWLERHNRKMGHIFYVMGKSASGKDTIYKILRERLPQIRTVVPYTTRPIRAGERDGVE